VLLDGGNNAGATFGGHRTLKIWKGKKRKKIYFVLRQLSSLTANIFGLERAIDKR